MKGIAFAISGIVVCRRWFSLILAGLFFIACTHRTNNENADFTILTSEKTGLNFSNSLHPDTALNLFRYMYFYNGSGIGAGDFNKDGKTDIFFAANQGQDKLFLNEGNLHFKDVTKEAGIADDLGWSTGVSIIDINNDGYLDIYVCRVSHFKTLKSKNRLLVCHGVDKSGVPIFKEEADKYGIGFSGYSTQAAFFDYDLDGDLDLFLMNHPVNHEGNYAPRANFLNTQDSLAGDKLFRNDNGHYSDITVAAGINTTKIGYGLGICVSDINMDGWPDIYIGNDFHENDYLYINNHNGTFRDENNDHLMHTSQFSMGVDVADLTNDGMPEIISMDMLPYDPYILKRSLGEDDNDIFYHKISIGYNYQYARNNLQYNRRNGLFSEVGLYSGIYATDWSWSSLLFDFNNDGLKDLFISNGIPKRMTDIDYINFISSSEIQEKMRLNTIGEKEMELINHFPEIKIPNKFFLNSGELKFKDIGTEINNDKPSFSNGAVYCDFDNDGDLDVVVNNINDNSFLYENLTNKANANNKAASFAEISLTGSLKNSNAIGSKVVLFGNHEVKVYENYPVRGFQSSMQIPVHIGLNKASIDSAFLIWPDNTFEKIEFNQPSSFYKFIYKKGLPEFNYNSITGYYKPSIKKAIDITKQSGLNYLHRENVFAEFNRESLIPHMLSTEGPALAIGDINKDGLEDVFLGASRGNERGLFVQEKSGKFNKLTMPAINLDSNYEDVDACFADINNDGSVDLVVASGGNEYYGKNEFLLPRVYLNDGKGFFSKKADAFSGLYFTESCVVPYDFNGDGFTDLFIGGRTVPWEYGETPRSALLQNDGTGKFKDVTEKYAAGLANIGFVTSGQWVDIDKNGNKDLLLSLEWGGIVVFLNTKGEFTKKEITNKKGWWNFVLPFDADGDGDLDFIAGNLGLNSRLKASETMPVRLYYADFDDNGKAEQVLSYYLQGREIPFASKAELEKKIPMLKKKFLYAEDFAKASMEDIFTSKKLGNARTMTADYFSNALLINDGNGQFSVQDLPWEAQLTSYRDAVIVNANDDSLPDVLLGGNYYNSNVALGRYDADFGTVLVNKGNGKFIPELLNGMTIKGQVRHIKKISLKKENANAYIVARNNDSTLIFHFDNKPKINK